MVHAMPWNVLKLVTLHCPQTLNTAESGAGRTFVEYPAMLYLAAKTDSLIYRKSYRVTATVYEGDYVFIITDHYQGAHIHVHCTLLI